MLILASQSPARQALLRQAGLAFEVVPAKLDELALEAGILGNGGGPGDVAVGLGAAKARAVAQRRPEALVIGADQTLSLDGAILHKPADLAAARAQLDRLAGRTHVLNSAVALVRNDEILWSRLATAELTMRAFSAAERDAVVALEGEALLASVGGYRLEGPSIRLFAAIEGDYFAILGLPLVDLLAALRVHGPHPETAAK